MMKFKPRKDKTYGVLIWGCVVGLLVLSALLLRDEEVGLAGSFVILAIHGIVIIFLLWAWFGTYYIVNEEHLIIRSGPIQKKIPLASIKKVSSAKSILASSALSVSRLEIQYNRYDFVHISLKKSDQPLFFRLLRERNPQVHIVE